MQERDMKILQFISDTRICTTKQIQDVLFQGVVNRVCYKRLQSLADSGLLKRKYYRVNDKNIYVYFLDKAPAKRTLDHDLLITEFYVELIRNGYEIISYEKNPLVAGIIPDAEIWFRKNNKTFSLFLEVQLSTGHDCIKKYYNLSNKVKRELPATLYIISDKRIDMHKLKDFKVVIDTLKIEKLNETFKGE